jgi:hypothetical protein
MALPWYRQLGLSREPLPHGGEPFSFFRWRRRSEGIGCTTAWLAFTPSVGVVLALKARRVETDSCDAL